MKFARILNRLCLLAGLCLAAWSALAQTALPMDIGAERERIASERAQHEARYLDAEAACYRRFAVSDCLRDARRLRRAALDELRRQEVVLNDLERKDRAAQALQRIQSNVIAPATATSTR